MEVVLNTLFSQGAAHSMVKLWAYIDPSTGSLIFQVVAASLISAGLFIKGLRDRIVWLITGGWRARRTKDTPTSPEAAVETARVVQAQESLRKAA